MLISNEKILRQKNEKVNPNEIKGLISSLEMGLNYSALMGKPGIGLACPQIGINKQAAIIRIKDKSNICINLINAYIEKSYKPFVFKNEGCLSFNDKLEDTVRFQEVVVHNDVEPTSFVASGLLSVAIQHELDHLNGILFFDRSFKNNLSKLKIKPNDLCICGKIDLLTGKPKKFKRCCGS